MSRLRGLKDLVEETVEEGSRAIEEAHLGVAGRSFRVLEAIPPLGGPVRLVHAVHDAHTSFVYGCVRLGNRVLGRALDLALDLAEAQAGPGGGRTAAEPEGRAGAAKAGPE